MRYKYFTDGKNKIIVVSSFAGKRYDGVAKCSDLDVFDEEKGKALAEARCNSKIAHAREKRAFKKMQEAVIAYESAENHLKAMESYYGDSFDAALKCDNILEEMLETL